MKPSEVAIALPELINDGISVFIHGKSGIGKSSVVKQTTESMARSFIDVRMSQLSEVDFRGFPMPDAKTKQMCWYPPDFLPKPNAKPSILFLDEMNAAHPSVLATAYQLILDRRIGNYELPDNCGLVAAGNTVGDRGVIHTMPAPLNNRLLHIDYELDAEDFQRRASADDIHPYIRAYLRTKTAALHVFDPAVNPRAFPSPRAWYTVDKLFKNDKYKLATKIELIKGTIGEGAGVEFYGFIKDLKDMPDIDSILLNPKEAKLPGSQPVMHAVITTLVDKTKASNYTRMMLYVSRLPDEIQMVFNRHVVIKDANITGIKEYVAWCLKNQKMLGV
jgi:hypothetical protein